MKKVKKIWRKKIEKNGWNKVKKVENNGNKNELLQITPLKKKMRKKFKKKTKLKYHGEIVLAKNGGKFKKKLKKSWKTWKKIEKTWQSWKTLKQSCQSHQSH